MAKKPIIDYTKFIVSWEPTPYGQPTFKVIRTGRAREQTAPDTMEFPVSTMKAVKRLPVLARREAYKEQRFRKQKRHIYNKVQYNAKQGGMM